MRRTWQGLVPALVIGFGIVAATSVAKHAADWGITIFAAPMLLGAAILAGDILAAAEKGLRRRPSAGAWILAATGMILSSIVGPDAHHVAESMPTVGTVAWLVLLLPNSRPQRCLPPRS